METGKECPNCKCTNCKCGKCKCPCHSFIGILIALFGLNFLLKHFGVLSEEVSNIVWPVLIILGGLKAAMGKGKCKCCSDG